VCGKQRKREKTNGHTKHPANKKKRENQMNIDPSIMHLGKLWGEHWQGIIITAIVGLLISPVVTFPGGNPKTLWWVCAGCCIFLSFFIYWGFYVLIASLLPTPPLVDAGRIQVKTLSSIIEEGKGAYLFWYVPAPAGFKSIYPVSDAAYIELKNTGPINVAIDSISLELVPKDGGQPKELPIFCPNPGRILLAPTAAKAVELDLSNCNFVSAMRATVPIIPDGRIAGWIFFNTPDPDDAGNVQIRVRRDGKNDLVSSLNINASVRGYGVSAIDNVPLPVKPGAPIDIRKIPIEPFIADGSQWVQPYPSNPQPFSEIFPPPPRSISPPTAPSRSTTSEPSPPFVIPKMIFRATQASVDAGTNQQFITLDANGNAEEPFWINAGGKNKITFKVVNRVIRVIATITDGTDIVNMYETPTGEIALDAWPTGWQILQDESAIEVTSPIGPIFQVQYGSGTDISLYGYFPAKPMMNIPPETPLPVSALRDIGILGTDMAALTKERSRLKPIFNPVTGKRIIAQ
jgi:hypothetical protein